MKRILPLVGALLVLSFVQVAAQPQLLSYDLYYVLPGEVGTGGVDFGFGTPFADEIDGTSDFDLLAKYSLTDELEVGTRATFGFLNDARDAFSSLTLGAKYRLADRRALALNFTPHNPAEKAGISVGLMNSVELGNKGINSHLIFGFMDGYAPKGALVDLLVQPVLPLSERMFAYLDVIVSTDTDKPADRIGVLMGPNLDVELVEGLMLNAGIRFSVYSGDLILHDTDLGVGISLFKTAMIW